MFATLLNVRHEPEISVQFQKQKCQQTAVAAGRLVCTRQEMKVGILLRKNELYLLEDAYVIFNIASFEGLQGVVAKSQEAMTLL
jgi:hypothetical protein